MERQTSASSVDPRLKDLALRSKIKRKITIRKRMKSRIKSRSKTAELIRTPSPSLAPTLLPNPTLDRTLARVCLRCAALVRAQGSKRVEPRVDNLGRGCGLKKEKTERPGQTRMSTPPFLREQVGFFVGDFGFTEEGLWGDDGLGFGGSGALGGG